MKRVPEVLDCWFDSGAMPVAQWHYPFENQETFEKSFPADFICEAVDQTVAGSTPCTRFRRCSSTSRATATASVWDSSWIRMGSR